MSNEIGTQRNDTRVDQRFQKNQTFEVYGRGNRLNHDYIDSLMTQLEGILSNESENSNSFTAYKKFRKKVTPDSDQKSNGA